MKKIKCFLFMLLLLVAGSKIMAENEKADSLEALLNSSSDTGKIHILNSLYLLTYNSDLQKATYYAQQALKISRKCRFTPGIAISMNDLGNCYLRKSDMTLAEANFTGALKIYRQINDNKGIAKVSNNLGVVYEKKGDYNKALQFYLDALDLYETLGARKEYAATLNNIGAIYYNQDNPEKALKFFTASLNIKKKLSDSSGITKDLANIAAIHYERWDMDSAIYYYQLCLDIAKRHRDNFSAGKTLNSLGTIYMSLNKNDSAMAMFRAALRYSVTAQDTGNIVSVNDNLGLYFLAKKDAVKAIPYFEQSLGTAISRQLKDDIKNASLHLSEAYAMKGDYLNAYNYLSQYEKINSEILIERNQVTETGAAFLKQKQENRILQLEKEKEKRKSQVILLLSLIVIVILIAAFAFILYRNRQRSRLERTLAEQQKQQFKAVLEAQEKERKRIAGDLHDSVGQILSITKFNIGELLDHMKSDDNEHRQLFEKSLKLIDDACDEVRTISHDLMPGALVRLGLVSAFRELIREINESSSFKAELVTQNISGRFPELIEITYYRIFQELFKNIIEHAHATEVKVTLTLSGKKLALTVKDNGVGFNRHEIDQSGGIGWKNINSRLSMINGSMQIKSSWNEGTEVSITCNL